ncbi:MAG: phosphoenolpyruvate--protein phosphotransferase [Acidobacteriota bacterium]
MKDQNKLEEAKLNGNREVRVRALGVSRGVAIGRLVLLYGSSRQFFKIEIDDSKVDAELRRFRTALTTARRQLDRIADASSHARSAGGIISTQQAMLEDPEFATEVEKFIRTDQINAEWAVKSVTDRYVAQYKALPDEYIRERYADIEDVAERILTSLGGDRRRRVRLGPDSILVGRELRPSTLVELTGESPKALITEHGGWTSHTFILARELALPAVTGFKNLFNRVKTGDTAVVDGYNNEVILHPTAETILQYTRAPGKQVDIPAVRRNNSAKRLTTTDGTEILIRVNMDFPSGYPDAYELGARGIGLYRSEFLFNQFKGFPSETEQETAYREVALLAGIDGVKIRTFDLGVEQWGGQNVSEEKNPALGLRAIRLSLAHAKQFRSQIRALLRASHKRSIDVVIPMVSGISEIYDVKQIIERESAVLESRQISHGEVRLGAMIEVPSAVLMAKEIVQQTDFICLGTNDLIQYLLAVDRDNENVANWYRTLHPSVLRAIKMVSKASTDLGKSLIVCGEMAGSPFYVPLLLGLGVRELSMNINSIAHVRRLVEGIKLKDTTELAAEVNDCQTADEIEDRMKQYFRDKWTSLLPPDFFADRRR